MRTGQWERVARGRGGGGEGLLLTGLLFGAGGVLVADSGQRLQSEALPVRSVAFAIGVAGMMSDAGVGGMGVDVPATTTPAATVGILRSQERERFEQEARDGRGPPAQGAFEGRPGQQARPRHGQGHTDEEDDGVVEDVAAVVEDGLQGADDETVEDVDSEAVLADLRERVLGIAQPGQKGQCQQHRSDVDDESQSHTFGDADGEVGEVEAAVEPVVIDFVEIEVSDGAEGSGAEAEFLPDRKTARPADDLLAVELADDEERPERQRPSSGEFGVEDRQYSAEEPGDDRGDEHRAREALDEGDRDHPPRHRQQEPRVPERSEEVVVGIEPEEPHPPPHERQHRGQEDEVGQNPLGQFVRLRRDAGEEDERRHVEHVDEVHRRAQDGRLPGRGPSEKVAQNHQEDEYSFGAVDAIVPC